MDPVVQVDPERCLCVLGPQLAAQYLSQTEQGSNPKALSYKGLVEMGIQRVLEAESGSGEEKQRKEMLLKNAYELEPSFATNKVVETLKGFGRYEQWVAEVFSSVRCTPAVRGSNATIDWLQALQDKGMLLAYTHYDTVLDTALSSPPVLMGNEEAVKNWAARRTSGLLHVHGVHSLPGTMRWDCVTYDNSVGDSPGGRILKEVCKGRSVFFVGFDGHHYDPFLTKFATSFCTPSLAPTMAPLLISSSTPPSTHAFLTLKVPHRVVLEKLLMASKKGQTPPHSPSSLLRLTLLYADSSSCLEAADSIRNLSSVNASQLKLTQEHFHQLSMCVNRSGIASLWKMLFGEGMPVQLHSGLVGVSMNGSLTVWLRERPRKQEAAPPRLLPLPTMNTATAVSMISSVCAPIPSPSVSKLPPSSTRPTLPSPLVCSTKLSPHPGLGTPELPKHFTLASSAQNIVYTHPHKLVRQVRRVQSEQERLSYQDRLEEEMMKNAAAAKRNGMLVHQASAPTFVYTSEGCIAYPSDKAISVPSPSPLMKTDGHLSEHKIEYIDQYKDGKVVSISSSRLSNQRTKRELEEEEESTGRGSPDVARSLHSEGKPEAPAQNQKLANNGHFGEKKKSFIVEAREWSKKMDNQISRRGSPASAASAACSVATLHVPSSQQGLGRLVPPEHSVPRAPASVFGPGVNSEDQERLLRQHFEQIQQQAAAAAAVVASPSMPKLPLNSLNISTAHHQQQQPQYNAARSPVRSPVPSPARSPARSPRVSPRPSPKPSPIQMPTPNSVQGSPLHPYLAGQPASGGGGGAGMFGYFPSPSSLQSPAGFLCSPSVTASQYATMFNPYHQAAAAAAAMQMASPQQQQQMTSAAAAAAMAGGKSPVVMPDSAMMQNLHSILSGEKMLLMLPDGTLTTVPINLAGVGVGAMADASRRKEEQLRSPVRVHKRARSPETESESRSISPPKRRRSSSLPDITQFTVPPEQRACDVLRESDEEQAQEQPLPPPPPPPPPRVEVHAGRPPKLREPPGMIQIPKDMKFGDPMLGFPTPPQSSPLTSHFGAGSPIVLSAFQPQPMTPVTPSQDGLSGEYLKDLVEVGSQNTVLPSPEGTSLPPFPAGRGPIQLWQFLLELLLLPDKQHMIQWTGNGYEFRILQPEEIAKLWGARKNKPKMNYDKLSRGLRYYYSKGIMDKVPGKKLTFKYTCDVQHYVRNKSTSQSVQPYNGHPASSSSTNSEDKFKEESEVV